MKICACSQTPLIRLKRVNEGKVQPPIDISTLELNTDYMLSPGGVTRMLYPLLRHMLVTGKIDDAHWVSLNPVGPRELIVDKIKLHYVKLREEAMRSYGIVKERMWKMFHGAETELGVSLPELAWVDDYAYYTQYNRVCSEEMMRLDAQLDFDLFYVNDFQQIPTGHMLGTLKPKVFRWHIPFDEKAIPPDWAPFLGQYLSAYDAVVVSCRRYLETLKRRGYTGRAYHVYPYVNDREYRRPSSGQVEEFCSKFYISEDDKVIAIVARLDPMKGHDRAIKALAKVVRRIPNIKLLIVGNGSFTSSRQGLGISKGEIWRQQLEKLVSSLGLEGHVVFTGHITQRELEAVYTRCDFTLLPSLAEGFGLVVVKNREHTYVDAELSLLVSNPEKKEELRSELSAKISEVMANLQSRRE